MIGRHGKERILSALSAVTALPFVAAPVGGLVRKGTLPPSIWTRLPVRATFPVRLPDGGAFTYASTSSDFVGRTIYWRGVDGYEPETTLVFLKLAAQARVVLDIGANTGLFTLLACAASPHTRVISFEPVPRIYERLQAQIALNGWTERCDVHCAAVSNCSGTITLHVPAGGLPHSASMNPNGFHGIAGELIEVPVWTIDELCAGVEGIDLVKIDVENFEDKVLEGMQGVLAASAPTVVFEVIRGGPTAAIEAVLSRFGYRFYHLRADGPMPVETIAADPAGQNRNYLATARDDAERILGR